MNKFCPLKEFQSTGHCQPDLKGSTTSTSRRAPRPSRSQWDTISNSSSVDSDDGAMSQPSTCKEEFQSNGDLQSKQEVKSPFSFDFGFSTGSKSLNPTEIETRSLPSNEAHEIRQLKPEARMEGIHAERRGRIADYRSATENIGYQFEDQDISPPVHVCNTRSSRVCKACFPSRNSSTAISPLQTPPPREKTRSSPCRDAPNYAKYSPLADPVKQQSPSASQRKVKKRPISLNSRPRSSARVLKSVTNSDPCMNQGASTISLDGSFPRSAPVNDRAVFRGLHVATAAACDEDLDKWIEDITGFSARQFLADLSKFDGLGVNALANVARRAAKQRREEVRAWENVRRERRGAMGDVGEEADE